jgi:hypothetical protein
MQLASEVLLYVAAFGSVMAVFASASVLVWYLLTQQVLDARTLISVPKHRRYVLTVFSIFAQIKRLSRGRGLCGIGCWFWFRSD